MCVCVCVPSKLQNNHWGGGSWGKFGIFYKVPNAFSPFYFISANENLSKAKSWSFVIKTKYASGKKYVKFTLLLERSKLENVGQND